MAKLRPTPFILFNPFPQPPPKLSCDSFSLFYSSACFPVFRFLLPSKMAPPTMELDFFPLNNASSKPRLNNLMNRQRSFRDIQSAISKINPEVLRSVIASGSANQDNGNEGKKPLVFPKEEKTQLTALPLYPLKPVLENPLPQTAPLTIFYNGTVAVFDVPRDKAEAILKIAEKGTSRGVELKDERQQLIDSLEGDLPIARRKSLERFLEKRKERLTSVSPYYCIPESRV